MSRERSREKRAEQRAVVTEVLSWLRHELNNKLASVRNAAFYLERRAETAPIWSEPRVPKFFQLIDSELEAAETLLKEDGYLGTLFQPRESPVDLAACLERAQGALSTTRLVIEREGEPVALVAADRDELTLALRCLLASSVEATPLRMRLAASEKQVTLEMGDFGGGLAEAGLGKRFGSFDTMKLDQPVLGLRMARRIIERWHGALSLESSPTGGTRVSLTFPAVRSP
jgi:signal transduction histidine kinase